MKTNSFNLHLFIFRANTKLASTLARLERSRLKYERLSKLMIAMKAGVGHLQDKLEEVREDVGGKKFELSDDTVVDVLRECELAFTNILRRIRAGEDAKRRERMTSGAKEDASQTLDLETSFDSANFDAFDESLNSTRPFNQRIDLSFDDHHGNELDYQDDNNGGGGDGDDDELTRDKVKRASTQILQAVSNKKRKPKKGGNRVDDDPKNGSPSKL